MGVATSSGESEVAMPSVPTLSIVGARGPGKWALQAALLRRFEPKSPWELLEKLFECAGEKTALEYRGFTVEDVPEMRGQHHGEDTAEMQGQQPGEDTVEDTVEEYIDKFGLAHASCVLFVYADLLKGAVGECVKVLEQRGQRPVLLVRMDVSADEAAFADARDRTYEQLSALGLQHLACEGGVHLLDDGGLWLKDAGCWQREWQRLEQAIFDKLPGALDKASDWHVSHFLAPIVDSLAMAFTPMVDATINREAVEGSKLASVVARMRMECETHQEPVLSIVGSRGVGKSTILNSLRGLGPGDTGAEPVGATECTVGEAKVVNHLGLKLRDVPGADGSKESAAMGEEYIRKFKLHESDGILFVYNNVFSKALGECARILQEAYKKPVFFVRSKVEEDCRNEVKDGRFATHKEAFDNIKGCTLEEVGRAELRMFAKDDYVFLISARIEETTADPPAEPWQAEWHRLQQAIFASISDEAKQATVRAIMRRNAAELAALRRRECEKELELQSGLAWKAMGGYALVIPLMGLVAQAVVRTAMLVKFMRIFALNVTRSDDPLSASKLLVFNSLCRDADTPRRGFLPGGLPPAMWRRAWHVQSIERGGDAVGGAYTGISGRYVRSHAKKDIPKMAKIAEKIYLAELRAEMDDANSINEVVWEVLSEVSAERAH